MRSKILNDRYRLIELIGAGGMATVYRGEDVMLERPVAVKFLREPYASDLDARERFVHEARAAAKLDHPNIAHVYDVGEDEHDRPYIVMEFVAGSDLKALIRRDAPLTVPHALSLARQICSGVSLAHQNGIVHCDLKPQNILVTEDGKIKVADFGIARAMRDDDRTAGSGGAADREEIVWGSPHYLSPEQARGYAPTPASDVYSIGVVLYEMLTGVPPFHDPDPTVLAMKHLREEPAPLTALNPRVPPGLDWLVRKVLSKEPTQRYRNADQLGMAIDEYTRQGADGTQPFLPVVKETPIVTNRDRAPAPTAGSSASPASGANPPNASDTQPVEVSDEPDTTLWALIAVAAISVIGLIPLWLFVYRAYNAPPVLPTPGLDGTVAPTASTEELVTVPNLMGLSAADAQRLAESLGLQMDVLGEEETSDARPGAVLEQTPGPGNRVPTDTTVSVVLAAGRPLVLPDVIGYDLETVQPGLESDGLIVEVSEVRSTQPQGTVLEQTPSPTAEVRAGDTITLTVSGGSDVPIPLEANLNDQVVL
ncbi:MAG: Stk1 family PASTA domain-containing Ser/Thr kinase, partial [Anaerolineae bacterium]